MKLIIKISYLTSGQYVKLNWKENCRTIALMHVNKNFLPYSVKLWIFLKIGLLVVWAYLVSVL